LSTISGIPIYASIFIDTSKNVAVCIIMTKVIAAFIDKYAEIKLLVFDKK